MIIIIIIIITKESSMAVGDPEQYCIRNSAVQAPKRPDQPLHVFPYISLSPSLSLSLSILCRREKLLKSWDWEGERERDLNYMDGDKSFCFWGLSSASSLSPRLEFSPRGGINQFKVLTIRGLPSIDLTSDFPLHLNGLARKVCCCWLVMGKKILRSISDYTVEEKLTKKV